MREITSHQVNGLNEALTIVVNDEPGPGGACHDYTITGHGGSASRSFFQQEIKFQKGPIAEAGVNGISNEALLAIVADRLEGFQSGKFADGDNALALDAVIHAMECLHNRTLNRVARGAEGTSEV